MRASIAAQRAAIAQGALDDYAMEAARFHSLMAEAAGNKVMVKIIERLWARAKAMCIRPGARPALLDERVDEHARMAEAIAHRDPDAAEAEIRAHLRRIAQGLKGM